MQKPYHIMLVEDEPALAELLTRLILRRYPTATFQTYWSGRQALEAYARSGADLLIVDRGVSDIDGVALTRTLRERGDLVPIIGMSGNPLYREPYLAAGASEFVSGSQVYDQMPALLERLLPPEQPA
jgi:DNA-binding response OmpR family regulator